MTWVEVALTSDGFVFGWYDLENDKAGRFRWIGPVAILLNPSRADLLLASKSPSAKYIEHLGPRLAASSTGGRSRRHSKRPGRLSRKGSLYKNRKIRCRFGHCESRALRPAARAQDYDVEDERMLSVAITKIVFHYFGVTFFDGSAAAFRI
jgi:hypothetical protein